MSSALVALQRSGLRPRLSALPPLRFCVLFAGMKVRGKRRAGCGVQGAAQDDAQHVQGVPMACVGPCGVQSARQGSWGHGFKIASVVRQAQLRACASYNLEGVASGSLLTMIATPVSTQYGKL